MGPLLFIVLAIAGLIVFEVLTATHGDDSREGFPERG